jgi:hypothetical protein
MKRKSPRTESAAAADAGEGGEIFTQGRAVIEIKD